MRCSVSLFVALLAAPLGCSSGGATPQQGADPSLALLGGDTTIFDDGDEAFAYPGRNLSDDHRSLFQLGDGVFNRNWVTAPATPQGADGLGPTYNGLSCSACHASNGRGAPPATPDEPFLGLLLRLSVPGTNEHGGPKPDPTYGGQLNPFAILGVHGEGTPTVTYTEEPGNYADGTTYTLRRPVYAIKDTPDGPLAPDVMIAPRIAPQTVGLGLLEAVSEGTMLDLAKKNGGHPNHVWDDHAGATVIGRFGLKANQPSVQQQVFAAAVNDIGITSWLYPDENCPTPQADCQNAARSLTQPELEQLKADALVAHGMGLAVPARRRLDDPVAQRGERIFGDAGCDSCHVPKMETGKLDGWPELSDQTIRPFTDLLLHDMGPDLADGRPDFEASGSEWRTPPLWALGLVERLEGKMFLLHDGRARSFEEAILWHGGDAKKPSDAFRKMSKADRDALVAFLSSL
ncbi:MAG TPA: di-heme oxidoredictase family protein [Polyangiaceae bacterium]